MKSAWIVGLVLVFSLLLLSIKAQEQKPELIVQTGHTSSINSVAFSPDGKILATGSHDKTIKLWDVKTGQEIRTFYGHTSGVFSVAFSPDSKTIASGSWDKTVKLWEIETGQEIRTFYGHTDFVYTIAFSPDGKTLASSSLDKTVRLWDIESGQTRKTLTGNSDLIRSLAFSPSGEIIAFGSGKTIKLWSFKLGQRIKSLVGHTDFVYTVVFSPDSKTLVSGGGDNTIKLWDVNSGQVVKSFFTAAVNSVAFSPDGKIIVGGTVDNKIIFFDVRLGTVIRTLTGHTDGVNSVAFSPDGQTLASGSGGHDQTIKLWDTNSGREVANLTGHSHSIYSIAFNPSTKTLAIGSYYKNIKLWDFEADKGIKVFTGHSGPVETVAFSPDGKILASGGSDKKIKLWDVNSGQLVGNFAGSSHTEGGQIVGNPAGHFSNVTSVAFSPDGEVLASGELLGEIKLWDIKLAKVIKTFTGHSSTVASPKGKIFASIVNSIAFSPDAKILASASSDETIKLWDIESGQELKTLSGNTSFLTVAFSSDGKTLASRGDDQTIKLWDIESSKVVKSFKTEDPTTIREVWKLVPDLYLKSQIEPIIQDSKFQARLTENGGIKFFDTKDGKEICTLFAFDPSDWLVITPEGFFDGTPNAWKQLIWRFNNNTFDYGAVELYFNDFFYPNLLQDILTGKSPKPKAGQELEKQDRRQPKVEIASINGQQNIQTAINSRMAKVVIKVTDNTAEKKQPNHHPTSGAQDLRLFRNGSLVKIWHGDVLQGKSNVTLEADIPIVAGQNNFTAYAFNSSNVKSNDDSVSIKGADSLKKDGTLYVLAIGVNKYANSAYNLNFAVPDVEEIGAALKSQQDKLSQATKLKQYSKTEIITLTDENATKENILRALRRFSEGEKASIPSNASEKLKTELAKIKPTEPEDALIIQFSGHGTSREQRFYLLPHNFTDPKSVTEQAVSDVELNQALEKVDAGRLLMIIDACQSGQALGAKDEGRAPMNSKGLAQLAYDKGMLILTAAQSQQAALEAVKIGNQEIKHGLLTYALLEAFIKKDADKDSNQQLWEREWFDYATSQVPLLQIEAMKQRRIDLQKGISDVKGKSDLIYLDGDDPNLDPEKRRVQTPRVFYRREVETNPLIVAKP